MSSSHHHCSESPRQLMCSREKLASKVGSLTTMDCSNKGGLKLKEKSEVEIKVEHKLGFEGLLMI